MATNPTPNQPPPSRPMLDEADIGSGEKTPAQHETDEIIRQIPPLPPAGKPADGARPGAPQRS